MDELNTKQVMAGIIAIAIIFSGIIFFSSHPFGVAIWNSWFGIVQKVDDATNYKTKKIVEDTCRSMIASYEADRLTYELYRNSDSKEKQSWAESAKMRANKTAASFNNYIRENSFIWKDNIPADIDMDLPYIE